MHREQRPPAPEPGALLETAVRHHQAGRLDQAEALYRRLLEARPRHGDGLHLLGVLLHQRGRHLEAARLIGRALELNPGQALYHHHLGEVLRALGRAGPALDAYLQALALAPDLQPARLGAGTALLAEDRPDAALGHLRQAVDQDPRDAEARAELGRCLERLERLAEAADQYRAAVRLRPAFADAHHRLGVCLQALGRFEAAARCHAAALRLRPDMGEAALALFANRDYRASERDIAALSALLERPTLAFQDRVHLHFTLAGIHDRAGRWDAAFAQYRAGNRLMAERFPFDAAAHADYTRRLMAVFDAGFFEARAGFGDPSECPVFIVGMPRSGTTLVEQILASHPAVHGAGELEQMPRLVRELPGALGGPFPECATRLDRATAARLAGACLERLRCLAPRARRITDKLPGNFLRLGLIALLFPRARIVHCRRDPMDTCCSCYRQHFARGLRFSYDLAALGVAYREYARLMEHWRRALPLPVLDLDYEELVTDQEAVSRRLLDFCGLPWDARCLAFHAGDRVVRTASFHQVRQPLYAASVGRWQVYGRHLEPLREALGQTAPGR